MSRVGKWLAARLKGHDPAQALPTAERLEQRVLFSADLPWVNLDTGADDGRQAVFEQTLSSSTQLNTESEEASSVAAATHLIAIDTSFVQQTSESTQKDLVSLFEEAAFELAILDSTQDGLQQLTALAAGSGPQTMQVLTTADAGGLVLGDAVVSTDTLLANGPLLAGWREALADDANVSFLAVGAEDFGGGANFQYVFEQLTGAQLSIDTYLDAQSVYIPRTDESGAVERSAIEAGFELVFVDTSVEGYQSFIDDIQTNAGDERSLEVILLDELANGVDLIGATLAEFGDVAAIHIISHGQPGSLDLGGMTLDLAAVDRNAAQIAGWAQYLTESADILLYGCDVAGNEQGVDLVQRLAELTQADVAASTDATGHTALGGDWEFEYTSGEIEAELALSEQEQFEYEGLLDISTGLVGHWSFDSDATDSSGNGLDGALQGDAFIDGADATDIIGAAKLSLDGAGDYVDLSADVGSFAGLTQGTVSAWVRTTDTGESVIFGMSDQSDLLDLVKFGIQGGQLKWLNINDSGGYTIAYSDTLINDGSWHHVAVTVDATGNTLYIDGAAASVSYMSGSAADTSFLGDIVDADTVELGRSVRNSTPEYEYQGLMDDVRVYDRALTAADIAELYSYTGASEQTFVVTNLNDSGAGSLRQAILDANANSGTADTITFDVAGTITLASALPDIEDALIIDGASAPGYAGAPLVALDGSSVAGDGLRLTNQSGGSEITGLAIVNFGGDGIDVQTDNNWIHGNYLGVELDGATAAGNSGGAGVYIQNGATGNVIGSNGDSTDDELERNVIGGNANGVVVNSSSGNTIASNYIGVGADGTTVVANTWDGIRLQNGSSGNVIGGATAALGNVVSGSGQDGVQVDHEGSDSNTVQFNLIGVSADGSTNIGNGGDGVFIYGGADNNQILDNWISGSAIVGIEIDGNGTQSSGNVIQGNRIGTDATGLLNWGSGQNGILLENGADNNIIGGIRLGEGNIIAFSGQGAIYTAGVAVKSGSTGNSILGNSIYANAGVGIDLSAGAIEDGVTSNDIGDADAGGNDLQNFPVLAAAGTDGSSLAISGSINSTAYTSIRIEFFASSSGDASGYGEGETYLGYTTVFTDANGDASYVVNLDQAVAAGDAVSATATVMNTDGSYGSTSEFALNVAATSAIIVDTTADVIDGGDGLTSLREAVIQANATGGHQTIFLGAGTYTLSLTGAGEGAAATGDLDITDDITIVGAGADVTVIDGNGTDRIFEIISGSTSITGVTATNGSLNNNGGGILIASGAELTMTNSIVSGNDAGNTSGGGITNFGTATLIDVQVTGNSAGSSGGILNGGVMRVLNSVIDNNTATGDAGGITTNGAGTNLTLVSTTISGNSAGGNGGGLLVGKLATLINVTVTGNTANTGGGIMRSAGSVTVNLQNTIVAGNIGTAPSTNPDISGSIVSLGNNIIGDTGGNSGWIASDQQNVDPLLGALADNGGSTLTHALLAGSPAIGGGATSGAPAYDQRGYAYNGTVDIGAFGYSASVPNSVPTGSVSITGTAVEGQTLTATNNLGDADGMGAVSYQWQRDGVDIAGATTGTYDLTGVDVGATITVVASYTDGGGTDESVTSAGVVPVAGVDVPPINVVPGAQATSEDTALVFSTANGNAISLDDVETDTDTVTLSVTNGTLTLAGVTGLTFGSGDGTSDSSMTFTGTAADINAALDGLTFDPTAGYNGGAVLTIESGYQSSSLDVDAALVGRYTFDDGSASDSRGSNDGAFLGNTTTTNDAERGEVLSLDGSGDAVSINGLFGEPADVTLAAWVNLDSADVSGSHVISLGDSVSIAVDLTSGGWGVSGVGYGGGTWNVLDSGQYIAGTGWHHVAFSYDDTNNLQTLYIDGVAVASATWADSIDYTLGSDTYLGAHGDGSSAYDFGGLIDDARIYDRALSAAEIDELVVNGSRDIDTVAISVAAVNDAPTFDVYSGYQNAVVGGSQYAKSMQVQPDGKVLVAGYNSSNGNSQIVRLNADGTLDTSFGSSGIVTLDLGGTDRAYTISLQDDGKIIMSGNGNGDAVVARLNADGSVDTGFGSAGIATVDVGGFTNTAWDHALADDGSIFLVGNVDDGVDADVTLIKLDTNGVLDTTFGGTGIVTQDLSGDDTGWAVDVQADGKVVVAAQTGNWDIGLIRYNTDGTLDTGFGTGGIVITDASGNTDSVTDLLIQPDGKILVAGKGHPGAMDEAMVVRYLSDGTLDSGFGAGGVVLGITPDMSTGQAITLQDDGKILLAGNVYPGGSTDAMLARLNTDGSLDTSFNGVGYLYFDAAGTTDFAGDVEVLADGSVLLASGSYINSSYDFTLSRFDASGTADVQFGIATDSLGDSVGFTEGGAAVILDADVTIFDAELSTLDDFGGATLSLARNGGANSDDSFGASGNLSFNGSSLELSSVAVGTLSNTGGQLTLTFAAGVTNDQVNEVMRSITYSNTSDNPPASVQIDWTFSDGNTDGAQGSGGALQALGSTTVNITAINDDPVLTTVTPDVTFTEGGSPQVIDPSGTISDVDSVDFDGGQLTVSISNNAETADRLLVQNQGSGTGQVGVSGSDVTYENTIVGTFTGGTDGNTPLVITFNAAADQAAVQAVHRAIQFENVSDSPSTLDREVSFTVTDGDGGTSATGTKLVGVTAVNDAPVVTGPGSAYSFTEQGSLDIHGTGFSVADVDDNGGTLTATFTVGEGRVLIDVGDSGVTMLSGNFNTSGNSTDTVTFSGTKAQINALLSGASTGTIVYYHDQTAASDTPSPSTAITLTVNDQGNTGADPGLTGDATSEEGAAVQTINLTAVNDSPDFLGPNLITNGAFDSELTGWTTTGTVTAVFGRASLGGGNEPGPHTLTQTVATTAGETYVLEFDYRDSHSNLNQALQVTVDGSGNLLTTEQILTDIDGSTFVRYRYEFTADSSTATVTFSDTSDDIGSQSATTLGVDGAIDNVTLRRTGGELGTVSFIEDGTPVVLDADVTLFDAELDEALDNFDGATLTLVRSGGANSEDVLSFNDGNGITLSGNNLVKNGQAIGSFDTTTTPGQLFIAFTDTNGEIPTSTDVDNILRQISYANSSDTPPASVQIDWTFSDGNTDGAQGSGGELTASGSTTVNITPANDAPIAHAGGPYGIFEGDDLALDASASSDAEGDGLTYSWDINNDGSFGDAIGTSPTLSWAQLQSFGITDDGSYSIAVQVDDGNGGITTASTTLTVNNTAPVLSATGDLTVTGDAVYTLTLASSDAGDDTISEWTVNWGDGSVDTYSGNPSSVTHVYANDLAGLSFNITVSAMDEDGQYYEADMLAPAYVGDYVGRYDGFDGSVVGSFAPGSDGLSGHANIAIGPSGNYFVSGHGSGNVLEYAPDGSFVGTFVSAGDGGLSGAGGLAFGADGNLYVASSNTNEVLRFDGTTGAFIDVFVPSTTPGISFPLGLTFGPDGDLYVASRGSAGVLKFDAATGVLDATFTAPSIGDAEDIAFGPDGNLYVAGLYSGVHQLDGATGVSLGTFVAIGSGGLTSAAGVEFGPDGHLYVADQDGDAIRRYDGATGAYIDDYASGSIDGPAYMMFTPDHTVTVVAANVAPVGADNTVTIDEDSAYTFTAADFGFSDADGGSLVSVQITSVEGAGALLLNGADVTLDQVVSRADIDAGLLTFAPAANANGAGYDSFGFSVNDGSDDSLASYTMTVDVTAVNDAPVGAVTIDDATPVEGDMLTASNTITDADGIGGVISYQWYRDGAAITGETGSTYTTGQADVGTQISVVASYTDDQGTDETVASVATSAVIGLNAPPLVYDATSVFINEFHYDNAGTDTGESIELAGPAGLSIDGWSLVLYNGADQQVYDTRILAGSFSDLDNGYGVLTFDYPVNGIQNGAPDGIALIDETGQVIQFLSYEGSFTAVDGPASGISSTNIGVSESGTTPIGYSLQFSGTGTSMSWSAEGTSTFGSVNTGQSFSGAGGTLRAESVSEDTPLVISGSNGNAISLIDADAGSSDLLSVSLSVNSGTITLGSLAGLSAVSGDGTSTVMFDGTVADINAALDGLTYLADLNFSGPDTLTVFVDDQGNTGAGGSQTFTATKAITVLPANDPVVGQPVITGAAEEDQTLAVDTSGISDADGLGAFSYQWYRDGVAISGAVGATYTLGDADVDASITVTVSYTDSAGTAESSTSAAVGPVVNVNDAPTGTVTIDNMTPAQGDILTASNAIADADGISGAISYQWYRDGVAIGGATSSTYTTTQTDVDAVLSVVASYTDDQGTDESVSSLDTAAVTNVNDPVTGQPVITGALTEDQVLAADTSGISDEDGLGTFSYQWYRDGVAITGATASTYTLGDTDVGTTITVAVNYTDALGSAESATSAAVGPITNINDAPTGTVTIDETTPAEGQVLTASNTLADADGLGPITYTWYADGVEVGTGATYTTTQADVGAEIAVTATYTDGQGTAESVTSAATSPVSNVDQTATIGGDTTGTGDEDTVISGTLTATDQDGLTDGSYFTVTAQGANGTAAIDPATGAWTYTPSANFNGADSFTVTVTDDLGGTTTQVISLTVTPVNDPVTGQPVITGTPTEDQTVTADTSGIGDVDGLGTFSYQWYRDGVAIGGATASTYTLGDADVGTALTIAVSYTDTQGTDEATTSATVGPIANINDDPAGSVTIDNMSPAEGDLLTVSNTLTDADGLSGPINYQWYRDGVAVSGATATSYTTTQADVGAVLTVTASYTDDQGTTESATSAGTAAVTNINDPVVGQPVITGIPTEDQTLSADTSGITDEDGLGAFSYQWYRDGVAIGGAVASTYTLGDADVGANITVTLSYTDAQGTAESTTSAAVGPVANVNDAPTGTVTIDDTTPTEGQVLTVSNTLADGDGLGTIAYTWYADGVAVGSGNTYTTQQADVGAVITVTAAYTDGQGTAESVTSAPTSPVSNVDQPATIGGDISGTGDEDTVITGTLTATDQDGLTDGSYFTVTAQGANGTAVIDPTTGAWTFTPNADFNGSDSLTVTVTDDLGGTTTQVISLTVNPVNDPVTGQPVITGTPTEDQTLTADISGISDADGLGALSYQWYRDGVAIGGATNSTLTPGDADVGTNITVQVSYTDGQGTAESATSAAVGPITNVNDAPAGSVTIDNMSPAEGDTLTASDSLTDADGLSGAITYQWYLDGVAIGGATTGTYTTTQADVGGVITVTASYTDNQGTAESVSSAPTTQVTNVNDPVVGQPVITGTPTEDQVLTVDTSGISDEDGLGAFNYQWYRDGVAIAGATNTTLTLGDADVGANINVTVSYTDAQGTAESTTSTSVGPVANVNDAPSGAVIIDDATPTEGQVLTASNTLADADGLGTITYTWYADGVAVGMGSTYTTTQTDVGTVITVTASYTDSQGTAESVTSAATSPVGNVDQPATIGGAISGTGDEDTIITGTLTATDQDGLTDGTYFTVTAQGSNGTAAIDPATGAWTYTPSANFNGADSFTVTVTDDLGGTTTQVISLTVTPVNDPVTGQPVITGTPTEDQTVTAGTSGIGDVDGLGTFSYQWYRDGVAISGATASTYTLGDADVGTQLTVAVSYTDLAGTAESTTSAAIGPISNVNDSPTGSVTIDNMSPSQGDVLTASNTLSDADGLSGAITYQWYRDGSAIGGATGISYTTTQADVGGVLSVVASYTDDQGTAETVGSMATAAVANVNDPVTGQAVITGTPREDQTLTAETSAIGDLDGLGAFNYQWYRDGVAISGATTATYTLGDADVSSLITVAVSFTDGHGASESVISSAVGPIENVNDAPTAQDGVVTASEDTDYVFDVNDFGFSDIDGNQLHAIVVSSLPASGTLYVDSNADGVIDAGEALADGDWVMRSDIDAGLLKYKPAADANGAASASFNFHVRDDGGAANGGVDLAVQPSTLSIDIIPVNDEQVLAINAGLTVSEGGAGVVNSRALQVSDVDNAAAELVYTLTGVPSNGALSIGALDLVIGDRFTQADIDAGLLAYRHDGSETTSDAFTFSVDDGAGEAVSGTFMVAVIPVNDPVVGVPQIVGDAVEHQILTANVSLLSDAEGLGPLSYQWYRDGIAIVGASTDQYQLTAADADAFISVEVSFTDGQGNSESALSREVGPVAAVNDPPVTVDDALVTNEDTPLTINVAATLLANDSDPEQVALTLVSTSQPNHGLLLDNLDGTFTYLPDADYNGPDAFTYTVVDDAGNAATATVSLLVQSVNDAPQVSGADTFMAPEGAGAVGSVLASDADGDVLSFALGETPDAGLFSIDSSSGVIGFTAPADFEAPQDADSDNVFDLSVLVSDGNGGMTAQPIRIQVTDVNEAPSIASASVTATPASGSVWVASMQAQDPDSGDTLTYTITGGNDDQAFNIDPSTGELFMSSGSASATVYALDVVVTDSAGNTAAATIHVELLNTGPFVPVAPGPVVGDENSDDDAAPDTVGSIDDDSAPGEGQTGPAAPNSTGGSSFDGETDPSGTDAGSDENAGADDTADGNGASTEHGPLDGLLSSGIPAFGDVFASGEIDNAAISGFETEQYGEISDLHSGGEGRESIWVKLSLRDTVKLTPVQLASLGDIALNEVIAAIPISPEFSDALDGMFNSEDSEAQARDLRVTGAMVGTVSLSAGFVVWILRAGSLLASALSTRPAWTDLDPLPILSGDGLEGDLDHII